MSTTVRFERDFAAQFEPLTLAQLNSRAAMLTRTDNKYVVEAFRLAEAAPLLARDFDVLDIDGARSFWYDTLYFDDAWLGNFFEHIQGRRRRFKVRTRAYPHMGTCYLEMKLKGRRKCTVKRRVRYDPAKQHFLDQAAIAQLSAWYHEQYDEEPSLHLVPTLRTRYRRLTLVAKDGGQRMTIDGSLAFTAPAGGVQLESGLLLVETKSPRGYGVADRLLRRLGQRPVPRCSKYCLGLIAVGAVDKSNKFLPALRRLRLRPSAWAPEAEQEAVLAAAADAERLEAGDFPVGAKARVA